MGDQKDGLRGLTRFSDNEGDIIWPAWRAELKQRVAFEFGKIGNQIIEGEVKGHCCVGPGKCGDHS